MTGMRFDLQPGRVKDEKKCLAWMDRVADRVSRAATSRGLSAEAAYFLAAALREALLNAFCHGRDRQGRPWMRVRLRLHGDTLVLTVRDRGPGFDPSRVDDPLAPEHQDRNRGRGLFFMRQFSDRVSFAFPGPGGSLVRLEKRLEAGPTPCAAGDAPAAARR